MLYKIQPRDVNKAAGILAQSFIDYPIFEYILPDCEYRKKKISRLLSFIIRIGGCSGEVIAPSSKIEGVAIWIRPNPTKLSLKEILRTGFFNLFFHVDLKTMSRFLEISNRKQEKRAEIIASPYYLLDMIGVDPSLQRGGYGRLLIESKLMEIDHEKSRCYLETSHDKNIVYYQRYGFALIHRYEIKNVPVYCLLRKAKGSKLT